MSLSALKKSSASNFDKLNEKINALMNPTRQDADERFWQPTVDKAGNGYAVIRFLQPEVDELPFARVWDHGFKGPGGWYIENSLTTIGQPDPVTEHNNALWNSGNKSDKEFVSGTLGNLGSKRRLHFYSNILVVEDPANPENNGKVFIYRYGKRTFDKLNNLMNPKFPDQPKVNPFDLWKGANLKLRLQKVDGQRNYDESSFDVPSPIAKNDAAIEVIWKQTYSLAEFTDPSKFKSYPQLQAKLQRVLGQRVNVPDTVEDEMAPQVFPAKASPAKAKELPPWEDAVDVDKETDEIDAELAEFQKLANA